jgi:NitT/TauT family transport system ATP-binding protein
MTMTEHTAASHSRIGRSIIHAQGVNHSYEGATGWVNALRDFAIDIPENEFLCLLGPSGCGKSTFLKIVAGLMQPTEGQVLFGDKEIREPGLDRGIVFQEPALFPWLTVSRNVEFGLDMGGWSRADARARGQHVLEIVGLGKVGNLYPYQLSGGMRHRVAVARAWALRDAPLLLMDEPFSAIDAINRMTLQDYLVETWLKEPRTVIYVTHDIDEAVYLGDRVAIMTPGPGKVGTSLTIDLPRPRDRNSVEVARYKAEITDIMRRMTSR